MAISIEISNLSNHEKPVRIDDCVDGKCISIILEDRTARVDIKELERAIEACKH